MKTAAAPVLACALLALAGCSLPGRAFPGGPSPWLPGGAPGSVYGAPPAVTSPIPGTGANPATKRSPDSSTATSAEKAGNSSVFSGRRFGKAHAVRYNARLDSEPLDSSFAMIASLLVVCTGNICRSPIAAALFSARARATGKPLEVASAGTAAMIGRPPPEEAIELMAERGLDISGHRAQQITGEIARRYDLILVMERAQQQYIEANWPVFRGRVHRLGERRDEDVGDPYGKSKEAYRESLAQIDAGVEEWSGMLLQ